MTQIYTLPFIASLHERPAAYETQQSPYQPGDSHNRERYSSYSERKIDRPWSPPRSPVSDSNKRPRESVEMYQNQQEPNAPREKLPSLSSLFGSPSHQRRPAQSPFSDRQSPVFPTPSPLEARHPAIPIHADRPFDHNSYFQRPAQHHSLPSRSENVERLGFPPNPHPSQAPIKPESPRYEGRPPFAPINTSRVHGPPINSWSPRSQPNRPEHFSRDTSSSFAHHAEHAAVAHRQDNHYREGPHRVPVTTSFPLTPASTVVGDVATTKDGLGPKIWTGTQFLPRFVRQAEVPGEGMCYFYDDGTHCKTVIDAEAVNAHWGVTKAGKPRKRLAIACITCREKKIKCDPDYPRCVQCEKFGRICKFKNAPRGGQGSPDTPPADPEDIVSRPSSSRADGESAQVVGRENSELVPPRHALGQATPESETHHSKRQRTAYSNFTPVPSEGSPQPSVHEATSPPTVWQEMDAPNHIEHELVSEWHVNPNTTRPIVVTQLLEVFFKNVPEIAASMFPPAAFRSWALSGSVKTLDDLMLIYTVLALATVFSSKHEHRALGVHYASIARYACENRGFSIQLVQSRLLLSLYYFAINNPNDAWDFCGGAIRVATGLRLNVELEKSEDDYLQTFPYGLNRHGYAECRRRTFWGCYLMDRFNGFCSGNFNVLQPEDVFLRLPCDDNSFESQIDAQNPIFDLTTSPIQSLNWTIGPLGYLINVATIWGDVMANIYRNSQRQAPPNSSAFGAFYEATSRRLQAWNSSLPKSYTFSAENLRKSPENGKMNTLVTMHTMYHSTLMKLNRYIQQSTLTHAQLTHHVAAAHHHAESLLFITDALVATRHTSCPSSPISYTTAGPTTLTSPFVAYAIVSAIDILSSQFSLSSIPGRLASFRNAQAVLAELATFWQSAKHQQALVSERVGEMREMANDGGVERGLRMGSVMERSSGEKEKGVYVMRGAIERTFRREFDCIYG
ncbi:fungal-specific transcription factor domain-containing protein [Amylocarpus encephaloides]|uniref:Fungal-specific transcription factor domain-containing protein n=1 Tax=Amylocarpus encephaloides TaxID=45428 RepID=A0A9P7YFU0_9HELO|nr:fungal-specific transcription factor domain-containing protein [Amylocarpus encephaloides]